MMLEEMQDMAKRRKPKTPRPMPLEQLKLFDKPQGVRRLVEVKEAVRYGHTSKTRIYQLLRAKKITGYKDGKRTLIDLNSFDAYHNSLPQVLLTR
jgi:excisionase family DNA binding protein